MTPNFVIYRGNRYKVVGTTRTAYINIPMYVLASRCMGGSNFMARVRDCRPARNV